MFSFFQELTEALAERYDLLNGGILGVDVDPDLVRVAREKILEKKTINITFEQCDLTDSDDLSVVGEFLKRKEVERFDVIFCFSVSMWVHLNHGEDGLKRFLGNLSNFCRHGGLLVLEPQPWKCYQTAARRMRKLNRPPFKHLDQITERKEKLLPHIVTMCESQGFSKLEVLGETSWKRPIMLFRKH